MKFFAFTLVLVTSSLASADVWYNCQTANGFPNQFRVEIKSEMWARITMGEEDGHAQFCVAKRRFDYSYFDNIDEEYSAVSRAKECNLSLQKFAQTRRQKIGSFTLIYIEPSMLSELSAPQKGSATILTTHFPGSLYDKSDYSCYRTK